DTRAVVAKRCARMLRLPNSGIAASTLSTCSMVVECLQFGAALLAEGPQRISRVDVHQLAKFQKHQRSLLLAQGCSHLENVHACGILNKLSEPIASLLASRPIFA